MYRSLPILTKALCLLGILAFSNTALASDEGEGMTAEEFQATLNYQSGTINLGKDLATAQLPDSLAYLSPEDADLLLQAWGNPPSPDTLGMLVPRKINLFGKDGWAVIVTYSDEGHIDDEDAADIDYDDMLEEMQSEIRESNPARVQEGYQPLELLGWAETPYYLAKNHKLYWAKSIRFGESESSTLNYNVRILGREGVLELNAVTGIENLKPVKLSMENLMEYVEFNEGQRYTDYEPGTDKLAAYGIGALVAGKVAAKAGFFKGILIALMAAKKFVIIALIGIAAFIKKVFFGTEPESH